MQTYSCTPKQQNRRASTILTVLLIAIVICCALIVLKLGILLLNQFLFLAFAAGIVFILSRYFFTTYTYTITLMNGMPSLIITQRQGRRVSTVCNQELSGLTELHNHVRGASNPRTLQVDARYSYCISMMPDQWQSLYFIMQDGRCININVECDQPFLNILTDALSFLHKRLNGERVDAELAEQVFAEDEVKIDEDELLNVPLQSIGRI